MELGGHSQRAMVDRSAVGGATAGSGLAGFRGEKGEFIGEIGV